MGRVNGKVLYKGAPVTDATVTFMADGAPRAATGMTNMNGEFQLTTFDNNDGAIVGEHKVTVSVIIPPAQPMTLGELAAKGAPKTDTNKSIPAIYASTETTPLKRKVEKGQNDITIEIND